MNKMELLAPAGSMEAFKAAVESGADAVYIGGSKFNARAYADNLDIELLQKAVEYAHIRGVKVFVTVNIIILQRELEEALEYIKVLYDIHVDAVIVQDIGLATAIRECLPDFEVHCSTQMAIHNTDGASLMKQLGINRVVLARELSLQEIDDITRDTGIEAEIFIHGALCVCYSGQCYMSSLIGGRSGNRGKCAQPCRKKYRLYDYQNGRTLEDNKSAYLLSTRDLNTYKNLAQIAASRTYSLKIEGRMKRPEYVAVIVHHYKEALQCIARGELKCISEQAEYEMKIAFNRDFTEGYLFNKRNQEIVNTERPDNRGIYIGKVLSQNGNMAELIIENNHLNDGDSIEIIDHEGKAAGTTISGIKLGKDTIKTAKKHDKIRIYITDRVSPGSIVNKTIDSRLFQKANEEYAFENKRKIPLKGRFIGKLNEAPILEIWDERDNYIRQEADEKIQRSQNVAMTEEKIAEQLNKTKDTPYTFESLDVDIEAGSFLSVKSINSMRRAALQQVNLSRTSIKGRNYDIKYNSPVWVKAHENEGQINTKHSIEIVAAVRSFQAGTQAAAAGADAIYLFGDYKYEENRERIKNTFEQLGGEHKIFYLLPQITRNHELIKLELMLKQVLEECRGLGLVISNIGHLALASRLQVKNLRANFTLNAINGSSTSYLKKNGVSSVCISPEINLNQIKELKQASQIELEAMVYGYLPAMITEHCPSSAYTDCSICSGGCTRDYGLLDDKNKLFKILQLGNHRNMILNSDVLCAYDHLSNIIESGANKLRLDFYTEDDNEIFEIIRAYKRKLLDASITKEDPIIQKIKDKGFTKGHYFRGID